MNKNTKTRPCLIICFLLAVSLIFLSLEETSRVPLIPYNSHITIGLYCFGLIILPLYRFSVSMRKSILIQIFLLWLLFVISIMSALWSYYPYLVLKRSFIIFLPLIILSLMVFSDKRPIDTNITVLTIFSIFGFALSLYGLILYFFGSNLLTSEGHTIQVLQLGPVVLGQRIYGHKPFHRISSLAGNPNNLGAILMISIPATITIWLTRKKNSISLLLGLLIQIMALILTYSRTAIACTLIIICLIVVANLGLKKTIAIGMLLLVVLLPLVIAKISFAANNILDSSRFTLDLNKREVAWLPLLDSIREKPFLGVGFGTSTESILQKSGVDLSAHSLHIGLLSEIGIIGYTLFALYWLYTLIIGMFALKRAQSDCLIKALLIFCLSVSTGLIFHQIFEFKVLRFDYMNHIWGYISFTTSIITGLALETRQESEITT